MYEIFAAVVLGIIEGLTEFIPVSSTGHLILANELLGFTGDKAHTFDIVIQLTAILAVVWLYKQRFRELCTFEHKTSFSGWAGLARLGVACLPAFILGALLHDSIKSLLFFPLPVACALIVGGVIMIALERRGSTPSVHSLEQLTLRQAFLIGCFQCISLWPGMSRSASTIIGGLCVGLNRIVAAEFSFLVAVPVMCAAVGYELFKSASELVWQDLPLFLVGFIVSFITALLAIKFFLSLLRRWTLEPFGWYRIGVGVIVLLCVRSMH
ncbi:MAG: undecaprenyl-diphosphate phosphatase [Bdellovibrionota bacterium]|nr:MAG: undecaprenyl-diphosphate phosphatase [Bdellovibrionota bacterium]